MSQALSDYTFAAKYAKYLPELARRETWDEAVTRVWDMHRTFYKDKLRLSSALQSAFTEAEQAHRDRRVLGSMRTLQYGGEPILRRNAKAYNCAFTYGDRPRFFSETFWLLLCGCGVGFSVQSQHVAKLPHINRIRRINGSCSLVVEDSIEGWADALLAVVNQYFDNTAPAVRLSFSKVRPEGSPISGGARAPGPGPLKKALEEVAGVFEACIEAGRSRLRPIDVYDIVMHVAGAVLSGGIRRSATICLFSSDDHEMLQAKSFDQWWVTHPHRARSNNSAVRLRRATTYEQYRGLVEASRLTGDPGVIWTDDLEVGTNPCVEAGLYPVHVDKKGGRHSGVQFCNLTILNGPAARDHAAFVAACRAAAIIGTLQAGYTRFEYLGEISEMITRREALLGISITGIQDNRGVCLDPATLEAGALEIRCVNEAVAGLIGINPAARTTLGKPEGTSSCFLGTSNGVHRRHGQKVIRRVLAGRLEGPAQAFRQANPDAVEAQPNGDMVLCFPEESPEGSPLDKDHGPIELLRDIQVLMKHWVESGFVKQRTVNEHTKHSISNTITIPDGSWDEVARYVYDNRQDFVGVALLSATGDLMFEHPPFGVVREQEEIAQIEDPVLRGRAQATRDKYYALKLSPVSYRAEEGGTEHGLEPACSGGTCEV